MSGTEPPSRRRQSAAPPALATAGSSRPFLSIGVKLTIPVVLVVLVVALAVYFALVRQARTTLLQSKELAAEMIVNLAGVSVMPAIVFGDETEIERAVADLAKNSDVVDVELWPVTDGEPPKRPIASFHRVAGSADSSVPPAAAAHREATMAGVRVTQPIADPTDKTIAVLSVHFSMERESATLTSLARDSLIAALAAAVVLALGLLLAISRVAVAPLRRLQASAQLLEEGSGEQARLAPVSTVFRDEATQLTEAFANMATAVADREDRLALRNADLKLILDSVDQGFVTARADGKLLEEHSAILDTWVDGFPKGAAIWELIGRIDERVGTWVEAGWKQLQDDFLPVEVSLDQLPKRVGRGSQVFSIAYHEVVEEGELCQVVVVLSDVTAEVERERARQAQQEYSVLVDRFTEDRRAFIDFWNETSVLMETIQSSADGELGLLKRALHTLKGTTRFFGLSRISSLAHDLEDAVAEHGRLVEEDARRLRETWEGLAQRVDPLLRDATQSLRLSREEYEALRNAIAKRRPHGELARMVEELQDEPTERRLLRAKELLEATCRKLDKPRPRVVIEHNDVRLRPEPWVTFWSVLPLLLNNAADHGLETLEEREAAGKPTPATVRLETSIANGHLSVVLADDGRGIDWERVRSRAQKLGRPSETQEDLVAALFHDGVSTKYEVSEVSGRGVGLGAVNAAVEQLGGSVSLESAAGEGTTWRFSFPLQNG